jgi:hypothetical protein
MCLDQPIDLHCAPVPNDLTCQGDSADNLQAHLIKIIFFLELCLTELRPISTYPAVTARILARPSYPGKSVVIYRVLSILYTQDILTAT